MIQNTIQAKAGGIPRLAMINSFEGFGRCSTTVAFPVLSIMQVQVCPVPTSVLSNHLGFPTCYFDDYTSRMREYLHGWKQLNINFDGLYCGFLGSMEQIAIVKEFLNSPMMQPVNDHPLFLLDPVMGDHGKAYSTITAEHCEKMKELAAYADILTPNITEACLLTDTPYKDGRFTDYELKEICCKLAALPRPSEAESISAGCSGQAKLISAGCSGQTLTSPAASKRIVITGIQERHRILNYIWEDGRRTTCYTDITGKSHHGTGDLFASILTADALHQVPFADSVKKAADFVALCISGTEEAGLPEPDGVLFEKYLNHLI